MDQLRAALEGPHGYASLVTWGIAGAAVVIAGIHAVRRRPPHARWSRAAAVGFPVAVAGTLVVASGIDHMTGTQLEVALLLRMAGFWAMVLTAPFAVGQIVELRPPVWLQRTHLALASGFLLLQATTDLVLVGTDTHDPSAQFGPLFVPFLVPVAAFAGWWLLSCLGRLQTRLGLALFALGGSATALALVIAALVVDPVMADHFLVVGFLPVFAASQLIELQRAWTDRRPRRRPRTTSQ